MTDAWRDAMACRSASSKSASFATLKPRAPCARASAAKSIAPRSERGGAPTFARLAHGDGAVPLVVEDQDDRVCAHAHGGLQLHHRHGEASVAADGHGDPVGLVQRRGHRGGQAEAHGARGRADERPGAPEAEAACQPAAHVAGVRGEDGVVREHAPQGLDDATGVDARAAPAPLPHRAGRAVRLAVGGRAGHTAAAHLVVQRGCAQVGPGGIQEARGIRLDADDVGAGSRRWLTCGWTSTCAQRVSGPGMTYRCVVISDRRAPMKTMTSASSRRRRTVGGAQGPAMPR